MEPRTWVMGLSVAILLSGCDAPPPPGELVGRYRIIGTIATDTCGPGLGANRSIAFTAELRDDSGVGYWLFGDRKPTPGTIDADGNFLFQQQGGWTLVNPVPERGYAGCRVAQVETIDGKIAMDTVDVETDEEISDLSGANTIDVVPLAGDDCTPALAVQGGPWLALPCRLAYTLKGARLDVPDAVDDVDAGE